MVEGDWRCGNTPARSWRSLKGDRMSRARSARGGVFAVAGPDFQALRAGIGRRLPNTELLRRLVPVLLIAFACIATAGFTFQLVQGKRAALDAARTELALIADTAALNLRDKTLSSSEGWQAALAESLPKGATIDGRSAFLADAEGNVQAHAPLGGAFARNLLNVLGPQQPLTTFGAEAGVLRLTLLDDTDAIVTVRNIAKTDAQLAFFQPVDEALLDWRRDANLEIPLLVCTGLLLALLAGGLWYLTPARTAKSSDGFAKELTEALPGCGVWRLNLARGHVHWSAPMYRLVGLEPSGEAVAFRVVSRALHPDDDLKGERDRHLR